MQPIVFDKAGKFMLVKYEDGKPKRDPETVFFRNGIVQSITPNITINGTPIQDGNSLWAAMHLDTSIEGSIAVQLGFMPPDLYAFIMGDETKEVDSAPFPVIDEEYTIPDDSPYEVTLKKTPIAETLIVVDVHGKVFEKVTDAPNAGEYTLSGSKLTFNASDAGKAIYVAYDFTANNVTQFGLPKDPKRATYQLIVAGAAIGEDDTLYDTALIVDRSKVLGAINPPAQGGEPQPVTITFNILKPRGNNKAVDWKAVKME